MTKIAYSKRDQTPLQRLTCDLQRADALEKHALMHAGLTNDARWQQLWFGVAKNWRDRIVLLQRELEIQRWAEHTQRDLTAPLPIRTTYPDAVMALD
jgi:hypothetical protein